MTAKVVAGDLLDENFTHLEAYINHERRISGWDIDLGGGGSYDYGFGEWFKLIDPGKGRSISMGKQFVPQDHGRITLEYRFRMPAKMDGAVWELRHGGDAAISIYTCGNALWFGSEGPINVRIADFTDDAETGVKVEADIDANDADIYVNGLLKIHGVKFINPVSSLDNIRIATGGSDSGEMYLNPVKIHKGYIVCERFLTCAPGSIPSDWIADDENGTVASREFKCSMAPDIYSCKMENYLPGRSVSLTKRFGPAGGSLTFEFRFLLPGVDSCSGVAISGGGTQMMEFIAESGCLYFNCADTEPVNLQTYIPNLWYAVRFEFDFDNGSYIIHVNGKRKCCGNFISKGVRIDELRFHTSDAGGSVMWIDDILLYQTPPEPEDYVPEPLPVNGGKYILGMQVCSLWREGHHNGWDFIKPYPERKPYLGWYEEGPPEVSDWEIKWITEHGIDFQFYCWYRPGTGLGNPIKNPLEEFNLHDGYFYAKYSHMLKFAIMFENGNTKCAGFDDLEDNLIPFWTEYYLKDPRYMRIDGRPVFGIYSVDGLIRDFGGMDGAKKAVGLIRQAITDAGFEGAVMLCECRDKDAGMMRKIKETGFDCIYSYTWYTGEPRKQMEKMEWQRDTGIIDVLPTISMGWHTAPWGGTDANWASPEDFEALSRWVRDEFAASEQPASYGKRLIMLDNWNEFGEGHFMMPAELHGFGYLDALREVFTDSAAHTDIKPTDEQLERFNTLTFRTGGIE